MTRTLFISFMILASVQATALAEVYKCKVKNKVVFSDKPCKKDARPYERKDKKKALPEHSTAVAPKLDPKISSALEIAILMARVLRDDVSVFLVTDGELPDEKAAKSLSKRYKTAKHLKQLYVQAHTGVVHAVLEDRIAKAVGGDTILFTPNFTGGKVKKASCLSNIPRTYTKALQCNYTDNANLKPARAIAPPKQAQVAVAQQPIDYSKEPESRSKLLVPYLAYKKDARGKAIGKDTSIAYSAPNKYVIYGRESGEVHVYSTIDGSQRLKMKSHGARINEIAVSKDGKYLATGSSSSTTTKLWNLRTGELIDSYPDTGVPHAFTNDSRILFLPGTEQLKYFLLDQKKFVDLSHYRKFSGVPTSIAVSDDDRFVAFGNALGKVDIWKIIEDSKESRLEYYGVVGSYGAANWIRAVAFSPDNKSIYIAARDGDFGEWSLTNFGLVKEFPPGKIKSITSAVFFAEDDLVFLLGPGWYLDAKRNLLEKISLSTGKRKSFIKFRCNWPKAVHRIGHNQLLTSCLYYRRQLGINLKQDDVAL